MSVNKEFISRFDDAISNCRWSAVDLISGLPTTQDDPSMEHFVQRTAQVGFVYDCKAILSKCGNEYYRANYVLIISNICREAFISGNIPVAQALLEANFCNRPGDSVHYACATGDLELVMHHLEQHQYSPEMAFAYTKDIGLGRYKTGLQIASICGQLEVVKLLIRRVDVIAFAYACAGGHIEIVQYMLDNQNLVTLTTIGSLVPFVTVNDPLLSACENGRFDIVQLL